VKETEKDHGSVCKKKRNNFVGLLTEARKNRVARAPLSRSQTKRARIGTVYKLIAWATEGRANTLKEEKGGVKNEKNSGYSIRVDQADQELGFPTLPGKENSKPQVGLDRMYPRESFAPPPDKERVQGGRRRRAGALSQEAKVVQHRECFTRDKRPQGYGNQKRKKQAISKSAGIRATNKIVKDHFPLKP